MSTITITYNQNIDYLASKDVQQTLENELEKVEEQLKINGEKLLNSTTTFFNSYATVYNRLKFKKRYLLMFILSNKDTYKHIEDLKSNVKKHYGIECSDARALAHYVSTLLQTLVENANNSSEKDFKQEHLEAITEVIMTVTCTYSISNAIRRFACLDFRDSDTFNVTIGE